MQGRLFIQLIILLNRKLGWRSAYFAVIVFMLFLFSWTFCKLQLYFDLASAIFPWLISLIFACYHLNVNKYGNAMSTSQSDYEISLFRPPCYDKCYINNKTLWNSNTIHRYVIMKFHHHVGFEGAKHFLHPSPGLVEREKCQNAYAAITMTVLPLHVYEYRGNCRKTAILWRVWKSGVCQ